MFTVKERLPDGTENIYSCETIRVIGGPNAIRYVENEGSDKPTQRDMYQEGIFLDRRDAHEPGAEGLHESKHVIWFSGGETASRQARKGGKVWVMNEQGATVATYDL